MIRNCPTHGLNLWMIIQNIYVGLHFASRNLLDSAAGGTFMDITLGELMTHKYRGSIVVLSISKSVEPNEEQKEMTSGFQ